MRTETYTCDHCNKGYANGHELITLMCPGGDLAYSNPKPEINQINKLERFHALHFCNQKCFVNFFFNTKTK